jgi:hypothetical protein
MFQSFFKGKIGTTGVEKTYKGWKKNFSNYFSHLEPKYVSSKTKTHKLLHIKEFFFLPLHLTLNPYVF